VVLHFGDKQQQVAQALQAKHIRFDLRPLGMRISPHIYNNASDMDAVLCTARQFF
jgi:selenocysteine lyase/cysteine desulfurase